MANGRYAIMDRLAAQAGRKAPWPSFDEIDIAALAQSLGCPARRVSGSDELERELDNVIPSLGQRGTPILLEVAISDAGPVEIVTERTRGPVTNLVGQDVAASRHATRGPAPGTVS